MNENERETERGVFRLFSCITTVETMKITEKNTQPLPSYLIFLMKHSEVFHNCNAIRRVAVGVGLESV